MSLPKTRREWRTNDAGVAMVVFAMLFVGVGSIFAGVTLSPPTATVTLTSTTEVPTTVTSTFTQSVTVSSVSVYTYDGPQQVHVYGTASKANGAPTQLVFKDSGNQTVAVPIQNGNWAFNLQNRDTYTVTMDYSGTLGGGQCFVGILSLYSTQGNLNLDYQC